MYEIPYKILYRTDDKIKVTGLTYRKKIINFVPLPTNLKSNNYVYFGQYKNGNKKILELLKKN